jgi:hypothetical protein
MSDQYTNVVVDEAAGAAEENAKAKETALKKRAAAQAAMLENARSGKIILQTPIRSKSQDVTELCYDFNKLTGMDFAEAMDSDIKADNVFKMTYKQMLALFAKAASKATEGIDEIDITERLGAVDAMEAVQQARLFFNLSALGKNRRTTSA